MAAITEKELCEQLKEKNISGEFAHFLFGYRLPGMLDFAASHLAALDTEMLIFGINEEHVVSLPVGMGGKFSDEEPGFFKLDEDILSLDYKKGFLNHQLILHLPDGKTVRYKISRYIIPYPWHNQSVKALF